MAKLKGSSLLEATIGLVVITIVFTLGWMVVNYVIDTTPLAKQYRAEQALETAWQQTLKDQRYFNETLEIGRWEITKTLNPHPDFEGTYILSLYASEESGEKAKSRHEIVQFEE
jgi:hypothetical protein